MTTAIFSRGTSRRPVRVAAAAASLAGALALTACSGDGGSDDSASPSGGTSSAATSDTGGGTGGSASASASAPASASTGLTGSWLATKGGKQVILMVNGTEAGLFSTGGTVCSGTAGEEDGMQMIRLKCTDGNKDRTTGMVDSVGANSLKVTWEGGVGAETYTKGDGAELPSGLPTASLG
ncbi:hypothetical protein [Streptomyces sp. S.PB5]|uniref:hypothetical protein n=1 Tax=Streptomyces sp. S.PB5 TaxID=3020844 RepID=UPI0025B07652|nr:hypothetical protein [Streptomyces sp. S.PB5]MDN3026307.1 hypothetical protein [Streptomyces sp. S.PB5]